MIFINRDIKAIIASNITSLRSAAKMTQLELAEKLAYSDKSVSKWERAESVPDVIVLKQICDMFGVTLDWIVSDHENEEAPVPAPTTEKSKHNVRIIELLSVIGSITLAIIFFVIASACGGISWAWQSFTAIIPVISIELIVFSAIWDTRKQVGIYTSLLIWSLILFLHLLILTTAGANLWMLYLIGIPAQIITILAFNFKKSSK